MPDLDLKSLYTRVATRAKAATPGDSYTAKLLEQGIDRIAQKLGEEATETLIAAIRLKQSMQEDAQQESQEGLQRKNRRALCEESADLLYHLCLLWYACDTKPQDVYSVLERRASERDSRDSMGSASKTRTVKQFPMPNPYDRDNIFAKILRGEIPCEKVYEDEVALCFHDVAPQAPIHALVIPKGEYQSFSDFTADATSKEICGFFHAVRQSVQALKLEEGGYRLLANHGKHAGQEVPHFHVHICGGGNLGKMINQKCKSN